MTGAAGHEAKPCSNKNNNDFVLLKQKSCFELKALLQHPKCIYLALTKTEIDPEIGQIEIYKSIGIIGGLSQNNTTWVFN